MHHDDIVRVFYLRIHVISQVYGESFFLVEEEGSSWGASFGLTAAPVLPTSIYGGLVTLLQQSALQSFSTLQWRYYRDHTEMKSLTLPSSFVPALCVLGGLTRHTR